MAARSKGFLYFCLYKQMDLNSRFSFFMIFFLFCFFFFFVDFSSSAHICEPSSCNEMGPQIRFPFWLKGIQNDRCGYPGFGLSCNNQSQTILSLPASGDFEVTSIDYTAQAVYINDPEFCLPKRISKFDLKGSQFRTATGKKYTIFNCSSDWISYMGPGPIVPLICPGNQNYTVLATTSDILSPDLSPSCIRMPNVSVTLRLSFTRYWSSEVFSEDIELLWNEPRCRKCELQQRYCGFSSDSGLEVGCSTPPSKGLPRSAKYGIILGVGIPGLVCMIALACYACGRIRNFTVSRHLNTDQSATIVNPPRSISIAGLDGPTIDSYPKTVLGESRRLPKPNDGTCSICLSDYQPKESLRTIPECNHYFHADCIDEWLKLNGTCPLCRNAPESMTVTPCSSVSSIFSSSTSAA